MTSFRSAAAIRAQRTGKKGSSGLVIEASGPGSQIGCVCDIFAEGSARPVSAEVLGFKEDSVLLMPLEDIHSLGPGCKVVARTEKAQVGVGPALLGRVIDGLGNPIDGKGPLPVDTTYPNLCQSSQSAASQPHRASTGSGHPGHQRSVDRWLRPTHGHFCRFRCRQERSDGNDRPQHRGGGQCHRSDRRAWPGTQRVHPEGSRRGRVEKNPFVVVATSDHLPLVRLRGGFIATAIAEYFRDQGKHVNLNDGFGHPSGHGPAGNRPVIRRTTHRPRATRLPSFRFCPSFWSGRERRPIAAPLPGCTPSW